MWWTRQRAGQQVEPLPKQTQHLDPLCVWLQLACEGRAVVCKAIDGWLKLAASLQQRSSGGHRALSAPRATSVFTRLLHGDPQGEQGAALLCNARLGCNMVSFCDAPQGSSPACHRRC